MRVKPKFDKIESTLSRYISWYYESWKSAAIPTQPSFAVEQAYQKIDKRLQTLLSVNNETGRYLDRYHFTVCDITIEVLSDDTLKASFMEKYTQTFRTYAKGFSESSYETIGETGHVVVLTLDGSDWIIKDHLILEFEATPAPNYPIIVSDAPGPESGLPAYDLLRSRLWIWGGSNAAAYSYQWALNYNPDYRHYDNDCTNFASQCLLAGGKTIREGSITDREDNRFWWYGIFEATTSYTWAGAHNLALHLQNFTNSSTTTSIADLSLGDLVFIADIYSPIDGKYDHAMVVGRMQGDDRLMNYHSNNTREKSLTEILSGYPGNARVMIKIGNTYRE